MTADRTIETAEYMAAANTILARLGGSRFRAMTGAKHLVGAPGDFNRGALTFKLGRGLKVLGGATHVRVTLTGADLYRVDCLKVPGMSAKNFTIRTTATVDGIDCENLRGAFEAMTGLRTSL